MFRNILRALLGLKKYSQILNKNTSPNFHTASLVIRPLTMLKRIYFSELSISRFTTYKRSPTKYGRFTTINIEHFTRKTSSYNRNDSNGKVSLKRQRTPETTTDIQDVREIC